MRVRLLRYLLYSIAALGTWIALLFIAGVVIESRVPVNLPYFSEVIPIGDSAVRASGTWVIDGDKQGMPLQTTEILCEKEPVRCTSATAQMMLGKQLTTHLDVYKIVSWDKARIVFIDDSPLCVSYVYTMDLASKSVAGVRRKKSGSEPAAKDCTAYETELRLYLRKGFEVSQQLKDEAVPWFGHIVFAPFKLVK